MDTSSYSGRVLRRGGGRMDLLEDPNAQSELKVVYSGLQ